MHILVSNKFDSQNWSVPVPAGKNPVRIGRVRLDRDWENFVVLDSNAVPLRAGMIASDGTGWYFLAVDADDCRVGDQAAIRGHKVLLRSDQVVTLAHFTLT